MSSRYKLYEVGGHVRDGMMGIKSNDIDYTVVFHDFASFDSEHAAFEWFVEDIESKGYKVFQENPEVVTVRAKFPDSNEVADFVLARQEVGYREGTRRPLRVGLGSLEDDLRRRDFTVNALARDIETGEIVDLFNGQQDLRDKVLKTPVDAIVSLEDDPLRMLRALRFSVTKGFDIDDTVMEAMHKMDPARFEETVSKERIREELKKMFDFNTMESLLTLQCLKFINEGIYNVIFGSKGLKLTPTLKG